MKKNTSERPTADQLVQLCEDLCYPINQRESGVVDSIRYKSWGFISGSNEQVFFNLDSVYGNRVAVGDKVSFSKFPGIPRWRAHPVLKLIE
jgi:serine/threonine-protein kinase